MRNLGSVLSGEEKYEDATELFDEVGVVSCFAMSVLS